MDEELKALELELKQLRPVAPSRALQTRLSAESPLLRPRRLFRTRWLWVALPVAAAVLLIVFIDRRGHAPLKANAPGSFKPVAAENLLLDAPDEEYVTLADGTPARRLRQSYLDTITWQNPRTHASLTWSLPREEVRVIPVNFQ